MEMKKISVIMPAYNVEKYIGRSMQSVLSQTYSNIELIVINDGSSDRTKDVVLEYAKRDSRIVYYEQQNQGVSVARNTGMEKANGDYISFLDADDLWEKDMLSKLYSKMQSGAEIQFVYGRTEELFPSGTRILVGPEDNIEGFLECFIHTSNELRLRFHISAMLINKNLIVDNQLQFFPGITRSEDTGFMIEILCITKAYFVADVVSLYMRRESSATNEQWKPADWEGQISIYGLLEKFVCQHRPQALISFHDMRNYVAYRFVLNCIRHGYQKEAQEHIQSWKSFLIAFATGNGRILDRMKCRLMMRCAGSCSLLQFIGKL